MAVRDRYIEYVAEGICSIVNILQPEILSIGGGISREGDTLLEPIKAYFAHNDYNKHMAKTDIRIAKLFGDAGIVGAAKTAEAGLGK
jgi:glucokinase